MPFAAAALPIVSGIAGIAGAGISAAGAIHQGEAQAAEARYASQVAANNATIAAQNASYALRAGSEATFQTGLRQRAKAGDIRANLAAGGLDVNTGSAAEVRRSQAELGEQAELTTAGNAGLTAYGYRSQQSGFQAESQLKAAEAPMDVTGGFLSGTGTLLSNVGTLPLKWANFLTPASTTAGDWPTANMF